MCLEDTLRKKAANTNHTKYRVVAVGFTKKNDLVAIMANKAAHRPKSFNTHAECRMMLRYGRKLHHIIIARFGATGNSLPINPCPQCQALAKSYGIEIRPFDN